MRDTGENIRITYLDGLRGMAAMAVVFAHFFQFFLPATFDPTAKHHGLGENLIATTPLNLFVSGNQAVSIFFVLSGMVLAAPMFSGKSRMWYAEAALKRYPRLAIPALASVLIAYLIAKTFGYHYGDLIPISGAKAKDRFSTIDSISTAFWQGSVGAFFTNENSYNPVLWTISIELLGSFIIFAILPFIGRSRFRFFVYSASLIASENTNLMGFALGVILADALYSGHFRGNPYYATLFSLIGLWLGSYPYYGFDEPFWAILPSGRSITYHAIGSAFMIAAIVMSPLHQRILSSRPLFFLGGISYSLYLTHFQLLGSISAWSILSMMERLGYQAAVVLTFLWTIPASLVYAALFKRAIDDRAIAISGLISRCTIPLVQSIRHLVNPEAVRTAERTLEAGHRTLSSGDH